MDPTPTLPEAEAPADPATFASARPPAAPASYGALGTPSKIVAADLQVLERLKHNLALVKQALEVAWIDPKRGGFHVFTVVLFLEQMLDPDQVDDLRKWLDERSARQAATSPPSTPPSSPSPAPSPASPSPAKHSDNRRVDARALRLNLGLTSPTAFISGPIEADFRTQWRQIQNVVVAREYNPPQAWELCGLIYTGSALAALTKAMTQHYGVPSNRLFEHLRQAWIRFDWAAIEELSVDYFNGPNFVCNIVTKLRSQGSNPGHTLDLFEDHMTGIDQVTNDHEPQWFIDLNESLEVAADTGAAELLLKSQELARAHCNLVTKFQTIATAMLLENMPEAQKNQYFAEATLSLDTIPKRHDRWAKMYSLDYALPRLRRMVPAPAVTAPVPLPDPVPVMPAISRPTRTPGRPAKYMDGASWSPPRRKPASGEDDSAQPARTSRRSRPSRGQPGPAKPGGQQKK